MSSRIHLLLISLLLIPGHLAAFTLVVDHASVESKKNRITPTVSSGRIDSITLRFGSDPATGYRRYQAGFESSVIATNAGTSIIQTEEFSISVIRTLNVEHAGYRFAGAGLSTWTSTNSNGASDNYLGLRLSAGGIKHLLNRFYARAALDVDLQYPLGDSNAGDLIDTRYGLKGRIGVMYGFSAAELALSYSYRTSIFRLDNGDSFENVSFGPMFTLRVTM